MGEHAESVVPVVKERTEQGEPTGPVHGPLQDSPIVFPARIEYREDITEVLKNAQIRSIYCQDFLLKR